MKTLVSFPGLRYECPGLIPLVTNNIGSQVRMKYGTKSALTCTLATCQSRASQIHTPYVHKYIVVS